MQRKNRRLLLLLTAVLLVGGCKKTREEVRVPAIGPGTVFGEYTTDARTEYMRVDTAVISFRQEYQENGGTDHGNVGYTGITLDTVSGKQLGLKDLLQSKVKPETFYSALAERCMHKAKEKYGEELFENAEALIRESIGEEANWYLDAAGLTLIFHPHETGSDVPGTVFINLPYTELTEMLKPEYTGLLGEGSAVLPIGAAAQIDLSEGMTQEVFLDSRVLDEEVWSTRITIRAGEQEKILDGIATVCEARIIRQASGDSFLVFSVDMASEDYVTYVYELTEGTLQKRTETGVSSRLVSGYVNTEILRLETRIDLMGTYHTEVDYRLYEDGSLEQLTQIYQLKNDAAWARLTTTKELPVVVDGTETLLPAGSQIRITATDQNGTAWFREDAAGIEGEIHYTRGDTENSSWPIYIDDVEETEYFEMLPYAG